MPTKRGRRYYTDLRLEGVGRVNISLRTSHYETALHRERILKRLVARGLTDVVAALKSGQFTIVELEEAYEKGPRAVRWLLEWAGDPKIEDLIEPFVADRSAEIKSAKRYEQSLKAVLKWAPANARISWLARSDTIESFKRTRLRSGLSPDTVNRDLAAISQLLRWHGGKRLARRAFDEVRWAKPRPRRTRRFSREEIARFLGEARQMQEEGARYPYFDIFITMLGTGLRPSEACRVRALHVDLEREELVVEDSKSAAGVRVVPLEGLPLEVLRRRVELASSPDELLFGGISMYYLGEAFRRIVRKLGIRNVVPRDLRRTHAQYFRMAGRDVHAARDQLGHTTTTHTERYLGVSVADERREMVRGALELMGIDADESYDTSHDTPGASET